MSQQSQYKHSIEIVEKIGRILGNFPGFRSLHADGRFYQGVFTATENAKDFSRAVFLNGDDIPVTIRFSKGGGDPYAHFSSTVGMAVRFYLPTGGVSNIVMLSQKLFIANTVEQFLGLLEAGLPLIEGGPVNKEGLQAFLATNPNSLKVFQMRAASPAPISFAHTEFNSIHAFHYVNAEEQVTNVRCHWMPVAGVQGQPADALTAQPADILYTELEQRLQRGPVAFDFVLELAEPGDPLNDATALWPSERKRVSIGRLQITDTISEEQLHDRIMNHDPTMLTDGIEPTDDPILQIRRGVYEVSAAKRSGGWKKV